MKQLLTAALLLICLNSKAQKVDTIKVKEGFVYVQKNKWGGPHKVKCDYIIRKDGKYYVNGVELRMKEEVINVAKK